MRKIRLFLAVLLGIVGAFRAAQADQSFPCYRITPNAFNDAAIPPTQVIAVGTVEWVSGNICSVLIDTTNGRKKLFFTAGFTVNNDPMWMLVRAEPVTIDTAPASAFAPSPYIPAQPDFPTQTSVALPTPIASAPPPQDPSVTSFLAGKRDRMAWETFYGSVVGDEKDGALWWSGQRSLKYPGSCGSAPTDQFRRGCEEAQAILGPSDVKRRADLNYRAGFNSL